MSTSTRTYAELLNAVQAFTGCDLTPEEIGRIGSLINFAAKRAYQASQYWERYLITAEPRTLSRGQIDSTEDSFHVYGAGTDEVNGLYQVNGTANSKARYSLYDSDGTSVLWDIEWDGSTDWEILVGADNTLTENTVYYSITDSATLPPASGWAVDDAAAVAPAPLLVDVAEVDTFLQIDRYDVFQDRSSMPVPFHAVGGRAIIQSKQDDSPLYVTYRKTHTETYGDGTSGTTDAIPSEWFNYMALHAAYMFMSGERQSNPNGYAGIAYREVEESMQDELMRMENQGLHNLQTYVSTHMAYDQSLI